MSAEDRRRHLEESVRRGGVIMTAKGGLTRSVPSTATLAQTPEEKRAAREELERRKAALAEEEALLGSDDEESDDAGDEEGNDLSSLTVVELRERAKEAGVEGYSTMNKADLVAALEALKS